LAVSFNLSVIVTLLGLSEGASETLLPGPLELPAYDHELPDLS
jgi:hypothetical protein